MKPSFLFIHSHLLAEWLCRMLNLWLTGHNRNLSECKNLFPVITELQKITEDFIRFLLHFQNKKLNLQHSHQMDFL